MCLHEWNNNLFEDWERLFLPAFATVVFCPEVTGIEKLPCFISDNNHRNFNFCLLVSCWVDEVWWCQESIRSFSLVPCSQCSRPQGKISPAGTEDAQGEVILLPCRPTPYFSDVCGVVPGDNGPLQGWNSETCKKESSHRGCKSHTVCPFWGRNYSNASFISLSHACTDSSTSLRTC